MPQCDARGGRNILHVKQYLRRTVTPRMEISRTRGGRVEGLLSLEAAEISRSRASASSFVARGITPRHLGERKVKNPCVIRLVWRCWCSLHTQLSFTRVRIKGLGKMPRSEAAFLPI